MMPNSRLQPISSEDVVEMVDNPLYGSNADVRKLRTLDEVGEGYSTLGDQNANKGRNCLTVAMIFTAS